MTFILLFLSTAFAQQQLGPNSIQVYGNPGGTPVQQQQPLQNNGTQIQTAPIPNGSFGQNQFNNNFQTGSSPLPSASPMATPAPGAVGTPVPTTNMNGIPAGSPGFNTMPAPGTMGVRPPTMPARPPTTSP